MTSGAFTASLPIDRFTAVALARPDLTMPSTAQTVVTLVFGVSAVLVLIWAISIARRNRQGATIWLYAGTLLATPFETFDLLLGHCEYPNLGQWNAYQLMGVQLPWFLIFLYPVYVGIAVIWVFERLRQDRLSVALWWKVVAGTILSAALFEPPALYFHLWYYIGDNQPFGFLGLPLWWAFANAVAVLGIAVVCFAIWDGLLERKYTPILALVVPVSLFGLHTAVAAPVYLTLNTTPNVAIVNVGTAVTCAVSLLLAWFFARYIAKRHAAQAAG